ncbi:MAG: type III-B CRISPR module RAMP protein Cmr1 [Methanothrix sp.]
MIEKLYNIQVITPIFGGGVKANENDPVTPIRPSSIRGHLRFWWRATSGAKCATVAELLQREGKIWGTTLNPSQVGLQVEIKSPGKTYPCAYFPENKNFPRFERNHPPYALFPFQGNKRDGIPPANCTSNVSFELKLNHPKSLSQDVDAAVWAWTNFGGIGARVRRGCGALYCKELSPRRESLNSWYRSSLEGFGVELSRLQDWPTLPDRFLVQDNNSNNVLQGWTDVVGLMQTFRQGQGVGRNPGSSPNRPGRSRWPEPESIRKATGSRFLRHSRMPAIPDDAFPRAELGLPIVFHFKDNDDPKDTELYPVVRGEEKTRMASPLILRPMICRNGEVIQLILKLKSSSPDEVVLKKASGSPRFKKLRDPALANYPNSPLGSLKAGAPARSSSGSALEGFLAFAKEYGFVEVN